jgi:hypothetical protein
MWAFVFFLILNIILLVFGMGPLESELFADIGKRKLPKSDTSTQPRDSGSEPFSQIESGQQQQQKDEKE